MKSVFVSGTDTEVGKTVVAAALLAAARAGGIDAVPMKSVQTGCTRKGQRLIAPDLQFALKMASMRPTREEMDLMCPCRFEPACSPHLAARLCRGRVDMRNIRRSFQSLMEQHEAVVVEGAGGVLVPLSPRKTMLDLMRKFNLPVVLAARSGLGTINHTLLSVQEIRRTGLTVLGFFFVDTFKYHHGAIEKDNLRLIESIGKVPCLGWITFIEGLSAGRVRPGLFRRKTAPVMRKLLSLLQ